MADELRSRIHEIDSDITRLQQFLSISSQYDPLRLFYVLNLAITQFERYGLLNQREDLDKAIIHLTESILLPPCLWLEHGPLIHQALFFLASALLKRLDVSKQPEDAIYAAKYFRHIRDRPHVAFAFPSHSVTTSLVYALALQVMSEAGDVAQNIEEMAVLCHELFTSDASEGDIAHWHIVAIISTLVLDKINRLHLDRPLDQVIKCLRAARMHKPDLREAHFALVNFLATRYFMTFVNDDYEEAASILDKIIISSPPGDSQDGDAIKAQILVTALAMVRSKSHEVPEYSEEAIYRARTFISSFPEHPVSSFVNYTLEVTANQRFDYFGSMEGLGASSGNSPLSLPVPVVSFWGYEYDESKHRPNKDLELLRGLLSGIRNNGITKFDEAIEKGRAILASAAPRHRFEPSLSELFCWILFEVFERTNEIIEYLNESINTLRQAFEHPLVHSQRFDTLSQLCRSLITRARSFPDHRTQDLHELVKLFSQNASDGHASLHNRFMLASTWAIIARHIRHPSVSTAYESAVSLMQDVLLFAPTLQLQHATLAEKLNVPLTVPLDYASYQVDLHRFEEAIETLERGRALLWSEMRHLRTPVDKLLQTHPHLAHKLAAVNRDLEELTKSIPPSHELNMDDGAANDLRAVDPFGRLLLKQRGELKERDKLISQIRALPGFDTFLTSPLFDTLRSAALFGPVIIINHSTSRSDILILLHNTPPSLIPTPRDFYLRASALKDKLFDSRHKYGLDSSQYDQTLASVLAELYKLVGKPVMDRLRQLQVPEQSRIWWCPTSVFCSLPLHAMGPIPSDDGEMRYFLDFYICSYTPTLSALIQSRNRDSGSQPSNRPSLLLVAQPDTSLPTVGGEIQVVRALDTDVTSLISAAATPAAVIDGFHHHRFVHFACHGTLEAGKPFEAGFELYGGERLTLLEIVRSHLPTAEFAFLSACHTAEVTEESVADEALHLAAAVQYCGFRSVVGTMWAMMDEDGRDLAENFYKSLFSTSRREHRVPYHERSAKALRFAVNKLRRKRRITLERWVNFVHYGA